MKSDFLKLTLLTVALALFSHSMLAQLGDNNPTGITGQFNGNVTTGGSYDPYTGNATRSITDLTVPGAVGGSFAFTRTRNSRFTAGATSYMQFGSGGGWTHSYQWIVDRVQMDPVPSGWPNAWSVMPSEYTLSYPDGRRVTFKPQTGDPYFRGPAGVTERFQPPDQNGSDCYLLLNDGSRIWFQTEINREEDENSTTVTSTFTFYFLGIIDPYGVTAVAASYPGDGSLTLTEPAGRTLKLFYRSITTTSQGRVGDVVIDRVVASDGRTVQYSYAPYVAPNTLRYTVLTGATYPADPGQPAPAAIYTYGHSNVGQNRPVLLTAEDPMYAGPMWKIAYEHKTGTGAVHGQIWREKHPGGTVVSELAVTTTNSRTETRGDTPIAGGVAPTRTFNYTNGLLTSWTDFKGKSSSKGYDARGFLLWTRDEYNRQTDFISDPVTGNVTQITHPLTPSDNGVRATREIVYGGPGCPDPNNADPSGIYYVHKVKDERGNWTTYWRYPNKRIGQIDYPAGGGSDYFTYYPDSAPYFGQVYQHTMTNGAVETFTYNSRGLLETHKAPATASVPSPAATVYTYYPLGDSRVDRLQTVTDPRNHPTTYDYNKRGQVTRVTHPDTSYAQTFYNLNGTVAWTADETQPTDPNKRTSYLYDDYKRVTWTRNPAGEVTELRYEAWGGSRDPYSHTNGAPYYVIPASQKWVHYGYDENLRRFWTRQAPGVAGEDAFAVVEYDDVGNVTKFFDFAPEGSRGPETVFGYDERNRRTSKTDPAPFNNQVTRWEYDPLGNVRKEIRPDQKFRSREYDSMNRLWKEHDEMNRTTTYEYYPSGSIKAVVDPKGQRTEFAYDERNLLKSRTYPSPDGAAITGWKYDAANNLIERPTVGGPKQLFTYDNRNRVKTMRWSNAIDFSDFDYDAAGRLTFAHNPYSTVDRQYDPAGRLILDKQTPAATVNAPASTVTPLSVVSRKTHGTAGTFDIAMPLTGAPGVESRSGSAHTLVLTFADAVTVGSATVTSGIGTVAGYNVNTNVVTVNLTGVSNAQRMTVALAGVSMNGQVGSVIVPLHILAGDADGNGSVTSTDVGIVSANSGVPVTGANFRADLNANGAVTSSDTGMVKASSGTAVAALVPPVVEVSYSYENGELRRLYVPGTSYDWTFGYDGVGRLKRFFQTVGGAEKHRYEYDLSSNVKGRLNLENGTEQTALFDQMNRMTDRMIKAAAYDSNQVRQHYQFSHEVYGYDVNSRLRSTKRNEEQRRDEFLYNDAGELTHVDYGQQWNGNSWVNPLRFQAFTPDLAGNRDQVNDNGWQTIWSSNSLNQYLAAAGNTVTNGSQHEISAYGDVTYRYLADGQLALATSSAPGAGSYELGYDALGRTVRRTTNGQVVFYAYDGARSILEYNAAGALLTSNLYGSGVDELIARYSNGAWQYFFQDRLGSTRAVSNAGGEVVEQYRYDAFGAPHFYSGPTPGWPVTNVTGSAISGNTTMVNNRVLFTGREWVPRHGFYEYRARAYHPGLGRFMSEDPLDFAAGDTNLYRYCGGDPVNWVDPSGLAGNKKDKPRYAEFIGSGNHANNAANAAVADAQRNGTQYGFGRSGGVTVTIGTPIGIGNGPGGHGPSQGGIAGSYRAGGSLFGAAPVSPGEGLSGSAALTATQLALDIIGLVPVIGEPADAINAAIYAYNGDHVNASLSAAAIIPVAGTAATAGKFGVRVQKIVKTRKMPGRDGGISRHIMEEVEGRTNSVTHQVFVDGKLVHQHQTHIGKYGTQRRFPDEWIEYETVP